MNQEKNEKPTEKYLIESMEHTYDDVKVWWKPNRLGYTQWVDRAGRYSLEEATQICEKAGPQNEKMWKEDDVILGKAGLIGIMVIKP